MLLIILVGPVLIGLGTVQSLADDELMQTGVHAVGTVVEVEDGDRASTQGFRVDFVSADGVSRTVWSSWASEHRPSLGETIDVTYRPSDPGAALVAGYEDSGNSILGIGVVLTGCGLLMGIFLLIRVLVRVWRRRLAGR